MKRIERFLLFGLSVIAPLLFLQVPAEGKIMPKPSLTVGAASAGGAAPPQGSGSALAFDPNQRKSLPYREGEAIVRFRQRVTASSARSFAADRGYGVRKEFGVLSKNTDRRHLLVSSGALTTSALIDRLRKDPAVDAAWPNYLRKIEAMPNDPSYGQLWGLHNTGQPVGTTTGTPDADIDAPEAWDVHTGSPGVVVADIDTGVDYTHVDLAANMWTNSGEISGDGLDNDGNGYVDDVYGIDPVNADTDPMDDHGHGTHTSGTIAAVGNNGTGVVGVSWQAKIMALKFIDVSGYGSDADAIECIEYAVAMKNAGVNVVAMNASWGGGGGTDGDALSTAIAMAGEAGIAFCAAAGNSGGDNDASPHYPSSYNLPNIIAVAATDQDDELAYFSQYGLGSVDLAAPGVNVLSTVPGAAYFPQPGDLFFDDLESGEANWAHGGIPDTWARSGENVHSGLFAWSDSPGANYVNGTNSWLVSAADTDLTASVGQNIAVGFWAELDLESGWDYLVMEFSSDGGATWTSPGALTGTAGWQAYSFVIPENHKTARFRFRLRLTSDSSVTDGGVHVDDVGIGVAGGSAAYDYYSGTSMATPHVAGAVALMAAAYPTEGLSRRINRIFSGVDPRPSLSGKLATGGRLNIAGSINPDLVFRPALFAAVPSRGLTSGTAVELTGADFGATPGRVLFLKNLALGQRTSQFRLRFRLSTDSSVTYDGVHVDDVTVRSDSAVYFSDDLESGSALWTSGGTNNRWAVGAEDSHTPPNAWSDSPAGNYLNGTDSSVAVSGNIDLSGTEAENVRLGFWVRVDLETCCDRLVVETSPDGGTSWYPLDELTGHPGAWAYYEYPIPGSGAEAVVSSWSDSSVMAQVPAGAGRFIVIEKEGGLRSATVTGSAWAEAHSTAIGRDGAASVAYEGRIYVFGGYTAGGMSPTSSAEVYDPASGWASLAPLPTARANVTAAVLDGRIYVIGGYAGAPLATVEAYDPAANNWQMKAPVPLGASFAAAAAMNGRIYVTGGLYSSGYSSTAMHHLFVYDPTSDAWSTGPSMMTDRASHGTAVVNGRLYVLGGWNTFEEYLSSVEAYDPALGAWVPAAPLPMAVARMGTATDGRLVYLVGGTNAGWWDDQLSQYTVYDPVTGEGSFEENSIRNLYTPRAACTAAFLPGSGLYALNGIGGGSSLNEVERLVTSGGGDFNGDGKPDLVWRESTEGSLYVWYLDGLQQTGGDFLSPAQVPANWRISAVGDFSGDGKPDILWRETTDGYLYVWYMDGSAQTGGTFLSPNQVPTNWQIEGVRDFNGDGKLDLLWRDATAGVLYVWFMDGATQTGGTFLSPHQVPTNWQIAGTEDFNADGKPDILWRETTDGFTYVWYMDGVTQTGGDFLSPSQVPTNWQVSAVGDFTGDGKPDILWRETTDGYLYVWHMDGVTQTGGAFLSPNQMPMNWEVAGYGAGK